MTPGASSWNVTTYEKGKMNVQFERMAWVRLQPHGMGVLATHGRGVFATQGMGVFAT